MNVILVDDEISMLLIMKKMISQIPNIEIIGAFQSSGEAYKFIRENRVDIAFVDIKMPHESGLELARKIMLKYEGVNVVFLTSYREYALEAFDVDAFDYIVKPVSKDRLERTFKRVMKRHVSQLTSLDNSASLSVYCLGGLVIKGKNGEIVRFSSTKSLELLAYLVLNKERVVSKWSILEDVFGGMPRYNAETYLNTTVYKLRKALESHGMKAIVISANESYRLDIEDMYIDFINLEEKIKTLLVINQSNLEHALETEKLFAGELFGDKSYYWSLPERERISNLYENFAKKLSEYLLENNDFTASLDILKKLVYRNELDEDVNCMLMRVFALKKERSSLIRQYERFKRVLQRELEVAPGRKAANLYVALRKSLEEITQ